MWPQGYPNASINASKFVQIQVQILKQLWLNVFLNIYWLYEVCVSVLTLTYTHTDKECTVRQENSASAETQSISSWKSLPVLLQEDIKTFKQSGSKWLLSLWSTQSSRRRPNFHSLVWCRQENTLLKEKSIATCFDFFLIKKSRKQPKDKPVISVLVCGHHRMLEICVWVQVCNQFQSFKPVVCKVSNDAFMEWNPIKEVAVRHSCKGYNRRDVSLKLVSSNKK